MEHRSSTNLNADPSDIVEGRPHNAGCLRLASSLAYIRIDRLLRQLIRKWWRTNSKGRLLATPSAEELQYAGIEFQRKEAYPGSFLDVEFDENGVLKIPFIYFPDNVQTIFQNLIAYEQCYPNTGTYFTSYASFMDDLINTAKDVQILRHAGILEHGLVSDEELAQLFNQWSRVTGLIFINVLDTPLFCVRRAIDEYYGSPWNSMRAYLTRNYFRSSWALWSLIAALLGLALTLVQTVISVKSA